jgi:hypothetical protein
VQVLLVLGAHPGTCGAMKRTIFCAALLEPDIVHHRQHKHDTCRNEEDVPQARHLGQHDLAAAAMTTSITTKAVVCAASLDVHIL